MAPSIAVALTALLCSSSVLAAPVVTTVPKTTYDYVCVAYLFFLAQMLCFCAHHMTRHTRYNHGR